jgi:hypothetical protein
MDVTIQFVDLGFGGIPFVFKPLGAFPAGGEFCAPSIRAGTCFGELMLQPVKPFAGLNKFAIDSGNMLSGSGEFFAPSIRVGTCFGELMFQPLKPFAGLSKFAIDSGNMLSGSGEFSVPGIQVATRFRECMAQRREPLACRKEFAFDKGNMLLGSGTFFALSFAQAQRFGKSTLLLSQGALHLRQAIPIADRELAPAGSMFDHLGQ